jgi:hypothetical protein
MALLSMLNLKQERRIFQVLDVIEFFVFNSPQDPLTSGSSAGGYEGAGCQVANHINPSGGYVGDCACVATVPVL